MKINTKKKGNKAEAIVLSEFVKREFAVLIPFGDNEKYDLVVEINGCFKSVQVKKGACRNGCLVADLRYKVGSKRVKSEKYFGKIDLIAIWCEENNKVYVFDLNKFGNKSFARLRLEKPKNNSCISTIIWAEQYEIENFFKRLPT
jgi:hypothetical protein